MSVQATRAGEPPASNASVARRVVTVPGLRLARRRERKIRRLYAASGVLFLVVLLVATVGVLDMVR